MTERFDERIWERVHQGRHVAVLGAIPGEAPSWLYLVRVSCDVPRTTMGPIAEARRKIAALLGHGPGANWREAAMTGIRRRLLGDFPATGPETALVEMCNRLARHEQACALMFTAVDAADEATCATLRRMFARPGWLELPVVLVFRGADPDGLGPAARRLLDTVESTCGKEAVVRAEGAAEARSPAPGWQELPGDVLRVLRAGAVIGSGFEAGLVAELLQCSPLFVLDCVQRAADAGVPIEDRGEERFFLPESMLASLRDSLLPSLRAAWHRRLGEILGTRERPEEPAAPAAPVLADTGASASGQDERASGAAEAVPAAEPVPDLPVFLADMFARADRDMEKAVETSRDLETEKEPGPPAGEVQAEDVQAEESSRFFHDLAGEQGAQMAGKAAATAEISRSYRDEARAAGHLSAAGQMEAAAERYAAAAGRAAAAGAYQQAMDHGRRALQLIEELPGSPARRHFRIQLLTALGRLQWQAAGSHGGQPDPVFTLKSALATADAAFASLREDDPPELLAEACELAANICYDLGDTRSVERALSELTRAIRVLLAAGQSAMAARLLNDQAAVHVRLGDPVRASHLLAQSQKIFETKLASDPAAVEELAETHHLIARLPLHAQIRPGREDEAFAMGIEQARIAEKNYQTLGAVREIARVWETMGRLELARGNLEQATQRLSSALQAQSQIGDLTGLARSTAALSEVLAASGKYRDALAVLGDSVMLNHEKGSPIGLAFNRRAFDGLLRRLRNEITHDAQLVHIASALEQRLEAAEAMLGRVQLPAE